MDLFIIFRCIRDVIKTISCHPELVIFFDIFDEIKQQASFVQNDSNNQSESNHGPSYRTVEIQTETHPIPCTQNKCPWNYSRQIVQRITRLQTLQTHSTQTMASAYRRDNCSQT